MTKTCASCQLAGLRCQYIALAASRHCASASRQRLQQIVEAYEAHPASQWCESARYLKNNPRLIWKFPYQQQPKSIDVFVDADFAARETMLRSTSGVAEFCGRSPIEFGSSTQSVRALSTGESEFYAITKGSGNSLHSQAILKGFGETVEAVVLSDASAGIGIASRKGCRRLEHLEVKWLWVQEKVSEKVLRLKKHPTETNIADFATKYLSRSRMEMLLAAGNLVLVSGERETSGEYTLMNSGGTSGEYILMHSEVKRFLFIVMLFLCVGGVPIGMFYYVFTKMLCNVHAESNDFLRDCTAGGYVGYRLDKRLEITGTGNGWSALKLCMESWWRNSFRRHSSQCVWSRKAVDDELNRYVSHSSCNTGALLQVADGKSGRTG